MTYRGRLMHDWVELDDTTQSMIPNPVPPKPRFSRGQRVIILLLDGQHEAITGSSILLEYGWYTSVTPLGKKEAILLPEQLLINYYDRDWWEERPSSRPEGSHWLRKSEYKRKCERLETVQSKWEAEKTVRDATRKEQE